YAGPWVLAPAARLDVPSLQVCLFERWGRGSVLRFGAALILGRLPRAAGFRVVAGRSVHIALIGDEGEEPRRRPVQIDGDNALSLPVTIGISPATVHLLCPA